MRLPFHILCTALLGAFALACAAPSYAAPAGGLECPHSTSQSITFSNPNRPDRLHVDIIGDDCETADIIVTIMSDPDSANRRLVHASRDRLADRFHTDDSEMPLGARVSGVVDRLVTSSVSSSDNLPVKRDLDDEGFQMTHFDFDWNAIERARSERLPIFFEATDCFLGGTYYAYLGGEARALFRSGAP